MAGLIEPDMLNAFAVMGDPTQVASEIKTRFGGMIDRVNVNIGYDDETVTGFIRRLKQI